MPKLTRPTLAQADGYEPPLVPECIASPDGKHHGQWWCDWCSDELFGYSLRVILRERGR